MPRLRINLPIKYSQLKSFKDIERLFVEQAGKIQFDLASQTVKDATPFVPLLTGKLRNSGQAIKISDLKTIIQWSALSQNNYDYSKIQYFKEFHHVDGFYAARWVDRLIESNPDYYKGLLFYYVMAYGV